MKKSLLLTLLLLLPLFLFAESYKIVDAEYNVTGAGFKFLGKTREYPLRHQFSLDTKSVFNSREALENYIKNYKQSLVSSRYFDEISVNYEANPSDTADLYNVILLVDIQDSHHLIVMPYPKYSSNSGLSLKLKAKDTNFLGSLNSMNTELNLRLDKNEFKSGFSFSFDYPFSIGPLDAVFVNDYSINYVLGDDSGIEWETETGLELSHSFGRIGLSFGIFQYTFKDISYKKYDDEYYFREKFNVGMPIKIATLPNFTSITYGPSFSINWNWDFNGINKENTSLLGPEISLSHSLSNGKITWNDNFRKGYKLSLGNSFVYNFSKKDLVPSITFEGQLFWNYKANDQEIWNRFGLCSNLIVFHYFDLPDNKNKYGKAIGDYLRGILDDNYFGNEKPYGTASTGIVLNLDLPHHVFTAYFPKEILSFELQFSPFFDMALVYDRKTERLFAFEDGYYCAGIELLVYPLKWSSVTVRASLGVDLRSNLFVEGLMKNKEIFIGLGLQY